MFRCICRIFTAPGDRVPGPRPIDLVQTIDLPWQEVIDVAEHVNSHDSYTTSMELCREGLLVGPSSGLAYKGLLQYLSKMKEQGQLDSLRNADGSIQCKSSLDFTAGEQSANKGAQAHLYAVTNRLYTSATTSTSSRLQRSQKSIRSSCLTSTGTRTASIGS
jgi:hypothetical protein